MAIRKTETSENRRTLSDNFDWFQSLIDTNRKFFVLYSRGTNLRTSEMIVKTKK